MEVQICDSEPESCLPRWDGWSLLVLVHKPKGRFARQRGIRGVGPRWRAEPVATRYKATLWIVDHDLSVDRFTHPTNVVCHRQPGGVDACRTVRVVAAHRPDASTLDGYASRRGPVTPAPQGSMGVGYSRVREADCDPFTSVPLARSNRYSNAHDP